jgi:transcriptional regulator with XRE-family HTH domain
MKVSRKPVVDVKRIYQALGRRLKTYRIANGLSQRDIGELLNMSRASAGLIEQGRQRISLHDAIIIATLLDFRLDTLQPETGIADVREWVSKKLHGSRSKRA